MKSQFRCCRRSPRSSLWPATVSASIATATRRNGRRNYPIRFKGRTVSGNAPTIPAPNAQNASVAKAATPALNTKHGRCCRHVVKNSSYRIPLPSGADWKWSRSRPRVNGFGPTMVCDSVLCELCVLCPDPTPDIGTTFTGRIEGDRFVLGEWGTPSGHGVEDAFEPC